MSSKLKSCMLFASIPVLAIVLLAATLIANNRPPNIPLPTPKMPVPNGWDDIVRAGKLAGKIHHYGPISDPNRRPNQWSVAELKSFVDDNAPVFAAIETGLRKPFQIPAHRNLRAPFGSLTAPHELAQMLESRAYYYERIGQFSRAMESRLDCIQLGATMPKSASAIRLSSGVAIEAIGGHGIESLPPHLDVMDLARAAERLKWIRTHRPPFSGIVIEDGYQYLALVQHAFSGRDRWKNAWEAVPFLAQPGAKTGLLEQVRFLFANKTALIWGNLEYYKALAAEQRGPFTGRSKVITPANVLAQSGLDTDLFLRIRKGQVIAEARVALLEAEVALRRYCFDHGSYPVRLSDLKPKYLVVWTDPFGKGKPLKYRQLGGGKDFILYSIGPDFKDNGGAPAAWTGNRAPGDLKLHTESLAPFGRDLRSRPKKAASGPVIPQ